MEQFHKLYNYYDSFTPFSDEEAWWIFKIAAFAEALGWTLLIVGIICKQIPFTGNEIPVAIGGRIHGMVFVAYIMAVLATGPSMRWSFLKIIIAGLFSIPPYGSLVFEQWVAQERKWRAIKQTALTVRMYQSHKHS